MEPVGFAVEPFTAPGGNLSRNWIRIVSNAAAATTSGSSGLGHSMSDFSSLVDLLNINTNALMPRPFREIETDYQRSVTNLEKARAEGELAILKVFEELQKCSYYN